MFRNQLYKYRAITKKRQRFRFLTVVDYRFSAYINIGNVFPSYTHFIFSQAQGNSTNRSE